MSPDSVKQQVIAYLLEENRTLHAKLGGRRICFTDAERRRLAALVFPLDRKRLKSLATLAMPDTLMRWYQRLVAQKFDGSQKRNKLGRPRVSDELEALHALEDRGFSIERRSWAACDLAGTTICSGKLPDVNEKGLRLAV